MSSLVAPTRQARECSQVGAIIIVVIRVTEATHHQYDGDRSGTIERDEVIAAVKDYFDGLITKDDVIDLIRLYFSIAKAELPQ